VPELYYSDFDSNSDDGILLLEDMHPAKQIPQMEGCTVKEVSQVLKEAAALHKSYWNDEKLLSYSWLTYGVSEERKEFVANLLPAVYPEWKNRYQGRISEDIFEMGDTLIANYDKYSEVREGPMTLVQGDLRLDNILFTDKNDRAILLDWQTAAVGLPLNDVAYCISTSFLDPNDRASAEEGLVKEYHALLEVNDSYSFEQAWNDYRRGSFVGFLMAVMSAMIVERTERGDEMFAVMAERSGWQALHLDAVSFLE
jgi:thiamine kinase-like enzyme